MLLKNYKVQINFKHLKALGIESKKKIYMTWFALVVLSFTLYVKFYAFTSLLVHPQYFLIFMTQLKNLVKVLFH